MQRQEDDNTPDIFGERGAEMEEQAGPSDAQLVRSGFGGKFGFRLQR